MGGCARDRTTRASIYFKAPSTPLSSDFRFSNWRPISRRRRRHRCRLCLNFIASLAFQWCFTLCIKKHRDIHDTCKILTRYLAYFFLFILICSPRNNMSLLLLFFYWDSDIFFSLLYGISVSISSNFSSNSRSLTLSEI